MDRPRAGVETRPYARPGMPGPIFPGAGKNFERLPSNRVNGQ